MSGKSRIYRDIRRLIIADFSHINNIRILAHNRTKSGDKRKSGFGVYLNLIYLPNLIFNRIFNSHNVYFGTIEKLGYGVKRGSFSGTGGTRRKNHTIGFSYRRLYFEKISFEKSEFFQTESLDVSQKQTHDDIFPGSNRNYRDADIKKNIFFLILKFSVLGKGVLIGAKARKDFYAKHKPIVQLFEIRKYFVHHPVNPESHLNLFFSGLQVDVRGATVICILK